MSRTDPKLLASCTRVPVWVLLTGVFLFVLGGCSFSRVATVKEQFCDFDSNFSYNLLGEPEVVFVNPVLLESDLEWVIGYEPTTISHREDGIVHSYIFDKVHETEEQSADFRFDLHYQLAGGKTLLKSIQFPGELTALEQFQAIDHAAEIAASADKICKLQFGFAMPSLEEDIDPAVLETLPSREELIVLLGLPSAELEEGGLVYEYKVRGQVQREPALRMVVWYDESGMRPSHMEMRYRFMGSKADFVAGKVHHFYNG